MGVFFYVSGLCFMISEFLEIKWIFIPRSEVVVCKWSLGAGAPKNGQLGAQNAASVPKTLQAGVSLSFRALFPNTIPKTESKN